MSIFHGSKTRLKAELIELSLIFSGLSIVILGIMILIKGYYTRGVLTSLLGILLLPGHSRNSFSGIFLCISGLPLFLLGLLIASSVGMQSSCQSLAAWILNKPPSPHWAKLIHLMGIRSAIIGGLILLTGAIKFFFRTESKQEPR